MPTCFQLYRRDTGEAQYFQTIDRELCQNLDLPYSDDRYTCLWYNIIGLMLAMGKTFEQITDLFNDGAWDDRNTDLLRINHYLMEHYTADSWHEIDYKQQ